MVYCDHCRRNVSGMRLNKKSLLCEHCGKVLEDLYLSQEATFVKDVAGQVDWYFHNEEEKHYNKIIWEEMNRQYQSEILLEQAAKEAAAKKAFEAKN